MFLHKTWDVYSARANLAFHVFMTRHICLLIQDLLADLFQKKNHNFPFFMKENEMVIGRFLQSLEAPSSPYIYTFTCNSFLFVVVFDGPACILGVLGVLGIQF